MENGQSPLRFWPLVSLLSCEHGLICELLYSPVLNDQIVTTSTAETRKCRHSFYRRLRAIHLFERFPHSSSDTKGHASKHLVAKHTPPSINHGASLSRKIASDALSNPQYPPESLCTYLQSRPYPLDPSKAPPSIRDLPKAFLQAHFHSSVEPASDPVAKLEPCEPAVRLLSPPMHPPSCETMQRRWCVVLEDLKAWSLLSLLPV